MSATTNCPGCGLEMPASARVKTGYYNASPECLSVYADVLGTEFGNVVLFANAHQLTVDSYATQHAGADHKDKSVCVHLVGLHLVLERGIPSPDAPRYLQRLAGRVSAWPHFEPPDDVGPLTIFDVAMADPEDHVDRVRAWAEQLWSAWHARHDDVIALAALCH